MIVRQFLQWLRHAAAGERAEATSALARAYLYSDLSEDDRAAAEGAMIMLLDDPSPLVRAALADALAASEWAPPAVILALASDQIDIAGPVLERSPLLMDADLVDMVATGGPAAQAAIADRGVLPAAVSAAMAEIGTAEACLILIENGCAEIAPFSLARIAERFGNLGAIREALLARTDVPAATRQTLVAKLSETLADFVVAREWLSLERADRLIKDACEKATVTLAADAPETEMQGLIRHLRESGQLTAGLILRALLSGNLVLFEETLAELSGLPASRVAGLVYDRRGAGFRALYEKAGLPASAYPAFREAVLAMNEDGFIADAGGAARLRRRMVERVLTRCEDAAASEIEPLLILLRRFATEAARDEARLFCVELVEGAAPAFAEPADRDAMTEPYGYEEEHRAAA
ncbi:MAG: DUF2336 domain-containing protein [Pseudorhodoplanes sp.]